MNRLEPTARPDRATRVEWDAEIEAIVAEAIAAEAAQARREAAPPSSAIVWWRAQMRARQEAAQAAGRPITIVASIAVIGSVTQRLVRSIAASDAARPASEA